ncbi:MAG TPA: endonuclease/exonuclease/phosphatase family protein [Jatrophihabitans sp.]|jgi:endonuclease/exonuclease/phosphatase family metal-dependent hydrolase|uniref:endonuclease/exonuclease/phosphatase family protein n=1 Tax=Jatrophihabitans sp. TaxID=1932789 RepID=UPI002DFBA420|nr:endonuclease/exonuclease/phosphatase family protein [Jatrophihabitans sp.]
MGTAPSRIVLGLVMTGALVTATPPTASAAPVGGNNAHRFVSVMTRNLDEGTDFGYVEAVAAGTLDFPTAVGLTYSEVVASDVCGRAARAADEIAAAGPDLVSLQEAAVWTGPATVNCPGAATPQTIDAEAALLSRLAVDGAHYTVVKELDEFSSAPLGLVAPGLSFLDRDVLLARVAAPGQLSIGDVQAHHYATLVPILGLPILRGWISADVTLRGRTVRVIGTHLESFFEPVQQAQGAELVAGPANTALPVIVAGDLNTGPGSDQQRTYAALTGPAGFTDTWSVTHPGEDGFTDSYYTEDPLTITSGPTERIDLVLVRGALVPTADVMTGTTAPHPSDHAGVIATVRIPS